MAMIASSQNGFELCPEGVGGFPGSATETATGEAQGVGGSNILSFSRVIKV